MSQQDEDLVFDPANFTGRARLFPLPNLVLFPHVIQPLRVFEPRYVELLHDALAHDRLITMALLSPGWESDYEGRPPIEQVACLGRVLTWQAQPKGQYNLLLIGLRRVRVSTELPPQRMFREAEVEVLDDHFSPGGAKDRPCLQRKLLDAYEAMLPCVEDSEELFNQVAAKNISLGALTDVISYALDLNVCEKQTLLNELDVDRRARRLLEHLHAAREPQRPTLSGAFPPGFSAN
jgi:Lon protease-like protein